MYQEDIYSTEKLPTSPLRIPGADTTAGDKSVFLGLHKREIIVYSICTGLVSFILLSCMILLRRYKKRNTNTLPVPHRTSPEQIVSRDMQSTERSGIYETIDESSTSGLPRLMHTRNQNNEHSCSSSDNGGDPLLNDGYLNPYQPMAQGCDKHGYSTIVDNSDSECSNSDIGERLSGYLNPYQTIVPDEDKHAYGSVNNLEKDKTSLNSDQSHVGKDTDANSYTLSKNKGNGDKKNLYGKSKLSDYADNCDMDIKVQAAMCVGGNELNYDEEEQTCDIELKLGIDAYAESSDKQEKDCHEVKNSGDTREATCHLYVI